MGQLFNRITNFAKSYINSREDVGYAEGILNSEDEELKRIIEDLNNEKKTQSNNNYKQNNNQNNRTQSKMKSPLQAEFDILGLATNATIEQIKLKYKQLVKENHPDITGNNDKFAQERMVNINAAYTKIRKAKGF